TQRSVAGELDMSGIAVGDLNNDGKPDVATASEYQRIMTIFWNDARPPTASGLLHLPIIGQPSGSPSRASTAAAPSPTPTPAQSSPSSSIVIAKMSTASPSSPSPVRHRSGGLGLALGGLGVGLTGLAA